MTIIKNLFGELAGKEINRFTLSNEKGNTVSMINYGATLISWQVKDAAGNSRDIVAGFDDLETYLSNKAYMGCIAGRYANRIANGKFKISGIEYQLACNNDPNHLHGGNKGFDKVAWDAVIIDGAIPKLSLSYLSKDGEEGYPGNLAVKIEFSYTNSDELIIEYFAETDKATVLNLTSHGYFNVDGDLSGSILDHSLQVNADFYTSVDEHNIPTGELCAVNGTAFDFNVPEKISGKIDKTGSGFDHNYVLRNDGNQLSLAAVLTDSKNELHLSVYTTEPGMQFYSGNLLDGSLVNRDGKPINMHSALCLETQHFPDSPNQPQFPSTILLPGDAFISKTVYQVVLT